MQADASNNSVSRYLWADFIRNIGVFLVILLHVSGFVVLRWQDAQFANWMAGNIYNVFARVCVPLLFMLSGALLLPRNESILDFYRKRVQKVVFPFLFWSVLYLIWKGNGLTGVSVLVAAKSIILSILTQPAEYHLWFMYELFGIYLIVPILRIMISFGGDKYGWYFVGIWFLFGPFQRLVETFLNRELIFDLGFLKGYIGYFVLGYLLTRIPMKKWMIWLAGVVYLISAIFTIYATLYYTQIANKLVDDYQYMLGINIVFLSISFFILLKAAGQKLFSVPQLHIRKWVTHLAAASFGIYLIHVFVLNYLRTNWISPIDGPSIYMVPVTTILVFIISWVIIAILQKIPILRSLVA
jgi:surface polysaccharide O-acyltransferase-like enzyme